MSRQKGPLRHPPLQHRQHHHLHLERHPGHSKTHPCPGSGTVGTMEATMSLIVDAAWLLDAVLRSTGDARAMVSAGALYDEVYELVKMTAGTQNQISVVLCTKATRTYHSCWWRERERRVRKRDATRELRISNSAGKRSPYVTCPPRAAAMTNHEQTCG